jgi:hypothetical protein
VPQSSDGNKRLIAELQDQLDKARETILQLQQLLQAKRGNFYEGIKLTPNQRTVVDMLLAVNGICTKESCMPRCTVLSSVTNRTRKLYVKCFASFASN